MWFGKRGLADMVRVFDGGVGRGVSDDRFFLAGGGSGGWWGQNEFNEFNFTGLQVFGLMVPTTTPTSRVYC